MVSSAYEMAIVMTAVLMNWLQYGYLYKTQDEASESIHQWAVLFEFGILHKKFKIRKK